MKVAMYYNNRDVRIEDLPKPKIGPQEMLVKMKSSGICGTDVLEWYRIKKAPLVLGHEMTGEIAELGAEVKGYAPGQRVFVSHHVPCNTCHYCLNGHHTACETLHTTNFDPGGFAEYIRVPKINVDRGVFKLPAEINYEAGTFIEPLGCVIRAQRICRLEAGQSVLILGGGVSGLLHLLTARARGAGRIFVTDVQNFRLKRAQSLGADQVFDARDDIPQNLRKHNEGRLADLVVVATGAKSAFEQAFNSVDRGGTICFFACTDPDVRIPLSINDIWRNDVRLLSSYGASPHDIESSIAFIRAGRIDLKKLITHRLNLTEAATGFNLVAEPKNSLKVILNSA